MNLIRYGLRREIFEDVTDVVVYAAEHDIELTVGSGGARWRQLMFMTQRIADLYGPEGVNISHHVLMNTE